MAVLIYKGEYRWRDDTAALAVDSGWYAAKNFDFNCDPDWGPIRLHWQVYEYGGSTAAPATTDWKIQWSLNSGTWTDLGTTGAVTYAASAKYADQDSVELWSTTESGGTATETLTCDNQGIAAGSNCELEWCLEIDPDEVDEGDLIDFRIFYRETVTWVEITAFSSYNPQIRVTKSVGLEKFKDEFTGTNGDAWSSTNWPTQDSNGSETENFDIQSNQGRMNHGRDISPGTWAVANGSHVAQDGSMQAYIVPNTSSSVTDDQWIYLCLRSSGEQPTSPGSWDKVGMPDTCYYIRIYNQYLHTQTSDDLFRRLGNEDDTGTETKLAGLSGLTDYSTSLVIRTQNSPFWIKWKVVDNGNDVDISVKMWRIDGWEPLGWATYKDTTPGKLLGATGPVQIVTYSLDYQYDLNVKFDDVFYWDLDEPTITIDETVTAHQSGTSQAITFAAIPDDGQMIVLVLYDRGGTEGTPPTGFTAGPSQGTGDWTSMWYREADSEASATYTITGLASDQKGITGLILDAVNGWDSTPTAGSATAIDAASATSLDLAAAANTKAGAVIGIGLVSLRGDYSAETVEWDNSYTELAKYRGGADPYITGSLATKTYTLSPTAVTLTASWTTAVADARGVFLYFREAASGIEKSKIEAVGVTDSVVDDLTLSNTRVDDVVGVTDSVTTDWIYPFDGYLYLTDYRFRDDSTALNTDAGWLAASLTNITYDPVANGPLRVRISVYDDDSEGTAATTDWKIKYSLNSAGSVDIGPGEAVDYAESTKYDDQDTTTPLLDASEDGGASETLTVDNIAVLNGTEFEWCIEIDPAEVDNGDTLDFLLYYREKTTWFSIDDGDGNPRITVAKSLGETSTDAVGVTDSTGRVMDYSVIIWNGVFEVEADPVGVTDDVSVVATVEVHVTVDETVGVTDDTAVLGAWSKIRPVYDLSVLGWDSAPTPSQDLWAQLDEVVPSDTDYIYALNPNAPV